LSHSFGGRKKQKKTENKKKQKTKKTENKKNIYKTYTRSRHLAARMRK